MADEGLWVPIVLFVSLAVIFSVWFYFKYKSRQETQQTFRMALELFSSSELDIRQPFCQHG